jgi:glutathionyl-hydroquinone reductase
MSKTGEFKRDTTYLDGRITADGRDGWPLEPGRYRLAVARGCPWANRSMIVRRLLGLEDALSMGICGPTHDWRSWTFDLDQGEKDPELGIHWLREAYEKAVPGYDRGVTVPAIVDIPSGKVVTSDFRAIPRDMETEWTAYHRDGAPDLPTLWAYARDLFQTPGFGDTIDFVQTKQHYYLVHKNLNPSGIVPDGPELSGWLTRHHREELGGRPFGDGTPPGPVRDLERVPASRTAH